MQIDEKTAATIRHLARDMGLSETNVIHAAVERLAKHWTDFGGELVAPRTRPAGKVAGALLGGTVHHYPGDNVGGRGE